MGWGTGFKTNVYISRKLFSSSHEVNAEIEASKERIQRHRETLFMIGASTPADTINSDDDAIDSIHDRMALVLDEIETITEELVLLQLYTDYLEENNITTINTEVI